MTKSELLMAQQFHLPVVVTKGKHADLFNNNYHINSITQRFRKSISKIYREYTSSTELCEDDVVVAIKLSGIKSYIDCKAELEAKLDDLIEDYQGIEYDITLEKNQRCIFTVDKDDIQITPMLKDFFEEKVKAFEKQKLEEAILQLVAAGKGRREINSIVKSIIDNAEKKG